MQPVEIVDDFFDRDHEPFGRQRRFLLHPDDALDQHIALAVGLLRVDEGNVRPVRRNRGQLLAGEGAGHRFDVGVTSGRSAPDSRGNAANGRPAAPAS